MGIADIAARAAKAAAIAKQIGELRIKISKARLVKTDLKNCDTAISNTVMQWTSRYSAFQSSPMSEVVVTDKFEGESAEKIRASLPKAIQTMNDTQQSAGDVQNEITEQITKLDEYITMLEEQISALMSEAASL